MTVHISSVSKNFTAHCEAIFYVYGFEVIPTSAGADILILDVDRPLVDLRGRLLTVVVSAYKSQMQGLPSDILFFHKPVDVDSMCDVVMKVCGLEV